MHNFTSLDFGPARPPELIVGTGGEAMDPRDRPTPLPLQLMVDGVQTNALTSGAFHDTEDQVIITCRLHAAHLACVPTARKTWGEFAASLR